MQQPLSFANKDIHKFITLGCLLPSAALLCLEIQGESESGGRALLWSSVLPGLLPSSLVLHPALPTQPLPSQLPSLHPPSAFPQGVLQGSVFPRLDPLCGRSGGRGCIQGEGLGRKGKLKQVWLH